MITKPKEAGGLGIVTTRHIALLMNQTWHLWTNPDSLWAKLLKAKYFPNNTLMDIHSSRNSSHVWKAFEIGVKWLFKDEMVNRRWTPYKCMA